MSVRRETTVSRKPGTNYTIDELFAFHSPKKSTSESKKQDENKTNSPPKAAKRIQLKYSDLKCLDKSEWVTDIIIDAYLRIVINDSPYQIGATNTYFGNILNTKEFERMKSWESIEDFLNGKYLYFLIPYQTRAHWILLVAEWNERVVHIYDSLNRPPPSKIYYLLEFLDKYTGKRWTKRRHNVSEQHNGSDCGIFLLKFAEKLAQGGNMYAVNQRTIKNAREEIKVVLENYIRTYCIK